jgi:hypothetical protein
MKHDGITYPKHPHKRLKLVRETRVHFNEACHKQDTFLIYLDKEKLKLQKENVLFCMR